MADIPLLGLSIDPNASVPLFQQVYDALRQRIVSGRIAAGQRMPASRVLAQELSVSRATIVTAYEQLVAEGFAEGRRGSGVYVCTIGEVETLDQSNAPPRPAAPQNVRIQPAGLRPFQPGRPDMRLFPHRQWGQCFARIARSAPETLVQQADIFGDPLLRHEICKYLAEWRGVQARPDQILITAGAADAVEICLRTLAQPGQHIAMEDPGYPPLRNIVINLGLKPKWLELDEAGARCPPPSGFGDRAVMSILTPSSQFPLGGAMTPGRRLDHLAWAKSQFGWIIEDDYDSEFRYGGRPIPALSSFDQLGRTLYIGSFSKVFSDTLRLGFLVMPDHLVERVRETLKTYGSKASLAAQHPLGTFMKDGLFYRHIRRMRRIYAERRKGLLDLLSGELHDTLSWKDHQAGMQIAVNLPPEYDDVVLSKELAQAGLSCPALSTYYRRATQENGLLLGFCSHTDQELQDAVPILKRILRQHRQAP